MVIAAALAAFAFGLSAQDVGEKDSVRQALQSASYPWYDPANDSARPIWPNEVPEPRHREYEGPGAPDFRGIGQILTMIALLLIVVGLMLGLAWAYRRYMPEMTAIDGRSGRASGAASRTTALPSGLPEGLSDPWAEAIRLRAAGNLSAAVVAIFVLQLRTLDRAGLIRLSPGKTARQLVRSLHHKDARAALDLTLPLFEEAFYGHRPPTAEAFAAVWRATETFRERFAAGSQG